MSTADKPVAPRKPRARRRKTVSAGDTPLDYMLKVMRDDEADQKRRDEMAKIAASMFTRSQANARAMEPRADKVLRST